MSIRIRADHKTMVCAAKSEAQPGDVYIDDAVHYELAVEMGILHEGGVDEAGADLWYFDTTKRPSFLSLQEKLLAAGQEIERSLTRMCLLEDALEKAQETISDLEEECGKLYAELDRERNKRCATCRYEYINAVPCPICLAAIKFIRNTLPDFGCTEWQAHP